MLGGLLSSTVHKVHAVYQAPKDHKDQKDPEVQ